MTALTPRQVNNVIYNASPLELEKVWIPKFLSTYTKDDEFRMGVFEIIYIKDIYRKVQAGQHINAYEAKKARDWLMNYCARFAEMTV